MSTLAETRTHIPLVNKPRVKSKPKPIRKVAKKRVKVNAEYANLREQFLKDHPYCQHFLLERNLDESRVYVRTGSGAVCSHVNGFVAREWNNIPASREIHHKKGRGKYLLDTSTWMAVSSSGHLAIHANPKESYAKGYMLPRR